VIGHLCARGLGRRAACDILLAINDQPLATVDQARNALAHADRAVALLIQRADARLFVPIRMGN